MQKPNLLNIVYSLAFFKDAQNTLAYSWAESSNTKPLYNEVLNISHVIDMILY